MHLYLALSVYDLRVIQVLMYTGRPIRMCRNMTVLYFNYEQFILKYNAFVSMFLNIYLEFLCLI